MNSTLYQKIYPKIIWCFILSCNEKSLIFKKIIIDSTLKEKFLKKVKFQVLKTS